MRGLGAIRRGAMPLLALLLVPVLHAADAAEYVGTARCVECHAEQAAAWRGSHHDLAMRHAAPEAVRGDFGDATLVFAGKTNRFFRRGAEYWVNIEGPDGAFHDYRIDYSLGVEPLQQYMTSFADGRIQLIPFAWDSRPSTQGGQRWFHLYPQFTRPSDEFFWTNRGQNWNFMCADCHSTNVRKGYDKTGNRYASSWTDVNVGCEACHGPGSAHLAWAARPQRGAADEAYARRLGAGVTGWQAIAGKHTLQPAALQPSDQLTVCAQCHSRRLQLHDRTPQPGEGFLDRHLPNLLDPTLFHADGQIDEEVFEYAPFLQSRMHGKGVVCSDCHEPHSARLRAQGDGLCTRCHAPEHYAATTHHRHRPDGAGAACVACHMPQTTYMQIDARRDHGLRVPSPARAARLGLPDACSACHHDKDAAWAAQALAASGAPTGAAHFAESFALAARREPAAEGKLAWIAQDRSEAPIVRASALQRLRGYGGQNAEVALARGARDAEPLLRLGAVEGSASLPPERRWQLLKPLLADPARAVRTQALAALLPLWPRLPEAERAAMRAPLAEYRAIQEFNADRGFGRTNLGNLHRSLGEAQRAEAEYRGSIAIEPYFVPAWVNLADLLRETGRENDAVAVLEQGLGVLPRSGELLHARGLAAVRLQQRERGTQWLGEAVRASPDNARFRYVYGIALQESDPEAALRELRRAWELERQPQYLYAACEIAARQHHASARACIEELRGVLPAQLVAPLEALL